jgi:AraC family transcriptional regulator
MRQRTRLDHEKRIEEAVIYLVEHLDETIDLRDLADRVCLSRFHFHRVFQALMGETAGDLVRRLRLERSAHDLRSTSRPITEIAFEAGYATHEAFIRAFRVAFATSPSAFRRHMNYDGRLPTRNGLHFSSTEFRFAVPQGDLTMQVEIREAPTRRTLCIEHRGPYYLVGVAFGSLFQWLAVNPIAHAEGIALYYDDPAITPPDELKSDAGVIVADDFTTNDPAVHVVDVPGGRFAVVTHVGPYEALNAKGSEFYGQWLPKSEHSLRPDPCFELYVNDCASVGPENAITELWIPVE